MQDLLIKDVDDAVITFLKQRAELEGNTPETAAKELLIHSMQERDDLHLRRVQFLQRADELSRRAGFQKTDSAQLIREDRDSR